MKTIGAMFPIARHPRGNGGPRGNGVPAVTGVLSPGISTVSVGPVL